MSDQTPPSESSEVIAHRAVSAVLRRILSEPDLGYAIGPFSETFELIIDARTAALASLPREVIRRQIIEQLQPRRLEATFRLETIFIIAREELKRGTLTNADYLSILREMRDEIDMKIDRFSEEE